MQTIKTKDGPIAFPDGEKHFVGRNKKGQLICEDYQVDRLYAAYDFVTDFTVAIDVGAHVGLMTRQLAKRFNRVIAFEPDPQNFACLVANTKDIDNVTALNVALGNESRMVSTSHRADNSGDTHLLLGDIQAGVKMALLDTMAIPDAGLIKIDVQGFESFVLEGADKVIQSFAPVVIVEVEPPEKLKKKFVKGDPVAAYFAERKVPLAAQISADRIYAPGPSGVRPFVKYAERGGYHWRPEVLGAEYFQFPVAYIKEQFPDGRQILDIGCGDGAMTFALDAYGIDDNAQGIAVARSKGVRCQHLNAYRMRYLRDKFRAACLFDVFEHMHFQFALLQHIAKLGIQDLFFLNPEPGEVKSKWHADELSAEDLGKLMLSLGWNCLFKKEFTIGKNNNRRKTFLHFSRQG